MTDYSAHDIHLLDQAYPDALNSIEHLTGDPARTRRLAEVGAEVFAAELTRELAATFDKPMSLAGWAAIATVRLMEAGKSWEEDTDAAWANCAELTAELAEERAEHQATGMLQRAANERADRLSAELANAWNALTQSRAQAATYANEIGALKAELEQMRLELFAQQPVIDAAHAWAEMVEDGGIATDDDVKVADGLHDAVERLRIWDLALATVDAEKAEVAS